MPHAAQPELDIRLDNPIFMFDDHIVHPERLCRLTDVPHSIASPCSIAHAPGPARYPDVSPFTG